jgi:hypothetical protein
MPIGKELGTSKLEMCRSACVEWQNHEMRAYALMAVQQFSSAAVQQCRMQWRRGFRLVPYDKIVLSGMPNGHRQVLVFIEKSWVELSGPRFLNTVRSKKKLEWAVIKHFSWQFVKISIIRCQS